jgi:hypothetical protein
LELWAIKLLGLTKLNQVLPQYGQVKALFNWYVLSNHLQTSGEIKQIRLVKPRKMFPLDKGLYERFQKNGLEYECVISPIGEQSEHNDYHVQFQVILKIPRQTDFIRFLLSSTGDGHWAPDQKN